MAKLKSFEFFFITYLVHKFSPEYANSCKELDIDWYKIQHNCLLPNTTHASIGDFNWSSYQPKESAEYILHLFPFIMSLNLQISCLASTSRVDPLFCSGIRKSWNQYHVLTLWPSVSDDRNTIGSLFSLGWSDCGHRYGNLDLKFNFKTDKNFDIRQITLALTVTDCGVSLVNTSWLVSPKFVSSQEGDTNTSVWCNVRKQSWCLRALLFGDEIQTRLHLCHLSDLFQCYSRWQSGTKLLRQAHSWPLLEGGGGGCWETKRFVFD